MATKANVPLFDESVDITDPAGAGKKFMGMAGGAALALAALGVGGWMVQKFQDTTGAGQDVNIPVAGGN